MRVASVSPVTFENLVLQHRIRAPSGEGYTRWPKSERRQQGILSRLPVAGASRERMPAILAPPIVTIPSAFVWGQNVFVLESSLLRRRSPIPIKWPELSSDTMQQQERTML